MNTDKIIEILDDFCLEVENKIEKRLLESNSLPKRNRKLRLSDSEIITIRVLFHFGSLRNFKHFYINYVCNHMRAEHPRRYDVS